MIAAAPRRLSGRGGSPLVSTVNEQKKTLSGDDFLGPIEVRVDRDNVGRAISQLKRLMAREGVLKDLKNRRFYEKPSVKEKRKRRDAERRRRKEVRKGGRP
jgi:small subunit ribosomal protein S21